MTKMEEICSVSFVDHEAASELLREFTGKEGGLATVDWYLLRNKIADAISMARVDEREKCRQLLSEAEKRERGARAAALEEAALWHDSEVARYTAQIAQNDEYLKRVGSSESCRANEYCDDLRSTHRRSAAHLRSLADRAALERSEG